MVPVATSAKRLGPLQYVRRPVVGEVEVERPFQERVAPESESGNEVERVACLPESVVAKSLPASEIDPGERLVVEAVMKEA